MSDLNNKMWYRLIKVLYITMFLVILITGLSIIYIDNKVPDKFIQNSKLIEIIKNAPENTTSEGIMMALEDRGYIIEKFDEASLGKLESVFKKSNQSDSIEKIMSRYQSYRTYPSSIAMLGYLMLFLLISLLFFEIIRRIFYYIVLGTLRPKK